MHTRTSTLAATALLALSLAGAARGDDTDIYLNPNIGGGGTPLVMFSLDYRSNLGSTVCNGNECDALIAEGYLPAQGPHSFFMLLRAVLKKVLDPIAGVQVGFMLSHNNTCNGNPSAGPGVTGCSNGGYILHGFTPMSAGTDDPGTYQVAGEDPDKIALFQKLDSVPDPQGNVSHTLQGKELYFELFRYLTGQDVYNGHLGYLDFGDNDKISNLDQFLPAASWDESIETPNRRTYLSPLQAAGQCARVFVVNLMFQVSSQEDDSDAAIADTKANGGMGGINLNGKNNEFPTVIRYLNDADLGDGTFGTVADLEGTQNVVSYFIVDPSKINITTNGYAKAGGTGVALPLSTDPSALIDTLNNVLKSILSVSTTFVAPSVPVNVFNRSQVVNEVFMALFKADENALPWWNGNLKKLRIADNLITGEPELQDANGLNAIDIDGRIRREALTFWTDANALPAPLDDEVAGADGRAVARGAAGQQIPGFVAGTPGADNTVLGGRRLYTEDPAQPSGLRALNADAASAAALWPELTADWAPPAASPTYVGAPLAEQARALNLLRFARGLEDDGVTTRGWLLSDPLHSRPRPVNYGARAGRSVDHPDIRILMGTNSGTVHMFRNTDTNGVDDGAETWGFVPRALLPGLARLHTNAVGTPVHPTGADGSVSIYTLDLNQDGTLESADGDRVIAYFGLRRGGKRLYALDISDPDSPRLLWTLAKGAPGTDFAELAQTWSTPAVGYLDAGAGKVPVLIFGGGYNGDDGGDDLGDLGKDAKNRATRAAMAPALGTDDDEGNAVFVVNALNGTLVWKVALGGSTGYDAGSGHYLHQQMVDSFAAPVSALDFSGDGLIDRIYAADTGGVVWRIDLAGLVDHDANAATPKVLRTNDPTAWTAMRLLSVGRHASGQAAAQYDRRFFNAPDVARSRDAAGPFDSVLIGSGDREDPHGTTVGHYFYMVKDRNVNLGMPPTTTLEPGDLADLSTNCLQNNNCGAPPDLVNGWRIALADTGEKALSDAVAVAGQVFFTTFAPTAAAAQCSLTEGRGRLYAVSLQDATAVLNFDTTNDVNGVTKERIDTLGSGGIPVKVVPLNEGYVLIQGQETGENILKVNAQTGYKTFWHETYD